MSAERYEFEPLGDHDRAAFSSGSEPLDRYLRDNYYPAVRL